MRHIISNIQYKELSGTDWTDIGMVPATGSLNIDTSDSKNGLIRTYRLDATLQRSSVPAPAFLSSDLKLRITYDSGDVVFIGTDEMPVRLDVSGSDTLRVSCSWQDAI